ncbi:MAG: ParB/RepB/Spo0J family partition protein [Treponema sp.]|nr:ParB/RepB/Spo0J family partition protein [Treponema sp.]MCL2252127.1 ParB/RepB/Spo0J family partition protein [Treponema sp.]
MPRRIGLGGKGIDALLDNNDDNLQKQSLQVTQSDSQIIKSETPAAKTKGHDVSLLSVDKLVPNPGQPRKNFDKTELQELADSIKTFGIIQPIIAANAGDGTYIIIAGERRTRAAKLAGLAEVPVIIRDYTDQKRLEVSLIENIQRTDLNPIEEAAAYKNLMDFSGISQDELAARMGKNRSTVANALRLLKLPVEMQKSVEEGKVSSGHARALLSVANVKARDNLYREILDSDVSVREAEKRAAVLNESGDIKKTAKKVKNRLPDVVAMEEKLISTLGTKAAIIGDLNKGRISIEYFSMDELDKIYKILIG